MQLFKAIFVLSLALLSAFAVQDDCYHVLINRRLSKKGRDNSGLDLLRTDGKGIACIQRTVKEIRDNVFQVDLQTLPAPTGAGHVTWWVVPQANESYSLYYNNAETEGAPVGVTCIVDASSQESSPYIVDKRCFDLYSEVLISLNPVDGSYCSSSSALLEDCDNLHVYLDLINLTRNQLKDEMERCIKTVANVTC